MAIYLKDGINPFDVSPSPQPSVNPSLIQTSFENILAPEDDPRDLSKFLKQGTIDTKGKFIKSKLKDVYLAYYGKEGYEKRLKRALEYNKKNKTGVDINKIMDSPLIFSTHDEGAEGFLDKFDIKTSAIDPRTGKTIIGDKYKGKVISVRKDVANLPQESGFPPLSMIIPHEGDHGQDMESGLPMDTTPPEWMIGDTDLTPSGNRLTELFAYGKGVVGFLNKYNPTEDVDIGAFDDPVKEVPTIAEKALDSMQRVLDATIDKEKRNQILNEMIFLKKSLRIYDSLAVPAVDPNQLKDQQNLRRDLNTKFKSLVHIENGGYVIPRA
jgi:hypothetical protein